MFNKLKNIFSKKGEKNSNKSLNKISDLLSTSPQQGILEAQNYLMKPDFSDFNEFLEEVKKTQKSNCCIVSWSKSMLSARCLDCQIHDNSCICIPCFLAGKHDQHHSYLLGGSGSGNCDCGDPNFWKPSGNCPNHPGPDPNPDVTQMTKENRQKFIDIFSVAYSAALAAKNDDYRVLIFDWITNFISFGDGLRRCVAIAVTSVSDKVFFNTLKTLETKPLSSLINLFGKLISDKHFAKEMGAITFQNYLHVRQKILTEIMAPIYDKKAVPLHPLNKYLSFSFHFFNEVPLMHLINNFHFNWIDFILNCLEFTIESVIQLKKDYKKNQDGHIISQIWYYSRLLEILMKKDDQHDNIQIFIDKYSKLLIKYERLYTFYLPKEPEDDSDNNYTGLFLFIYLFQLNCIFSPQFDSSPKNKTFSISQTFSSLLNFIKSQKNLSVCSIYESHKVPISTFLPLHHLFYCLLSSHQNTPEIILAECKKNGISLQDFCCLSTICPVRILAAMFVPERFRMLNNATSRHIFYCLEKPEETFNYFFGLVQTMLGIAPNKDQFLENLAITFGVNDQTPPMPNLPQFDRRRYMQQLMDYQNQVETQNLSICDVSIFIMSLLTDRSIINFDKILFKRLRVIELLKNKKPNSREIEMYVNDKLSNPIFGDDLQSYAERVSTSNGSFFRLTNEDEFTPFFPVIFRPKRTKILMKYTDKLIPFLDYVPPPRGLDFKICFRSPTFISLMFTCLTKPSLHFNQIGLAMFVESVKNGDEFSLESYELSNPTTIISLSISELIQNLREILIKDPKFNFLTLQIKTSTDSNAASLIDLVRSKQNLGSSSIDKANLPSVLRPQTAGEDQIAKEKKARAASLKQQLMREFRDKQSQFSAGASTIATNGRQDSNSDDDDNNLNGLHSISNVRVVEPKIDSKSGALCNICQTELGDDILGFPCLSLPSLFPALIDNALHRRGRSAEELEHVFVMSICPHHVHYRCCTGLVKEFSDDAGRRNDKRTFHCMIDRGIRNCFLPIMPSKSGMNEFGQIDSQIYNEALTVFLQRAFFGFAGQPILPVRSFAGIVAVLEVRHRSRPECLDSPTVPLLLHNLLLALYHGLRGCPLDGGGGSGGGGDPLVELVCALIMSGDPPGAHADIVRRLSAPLADREVLYEFLRRAAIVEDFAIKPKTVDGDDKSNRFIDWDEVLSMESLAERYQIDPQKIEGKMVELPLFETIPLAERFVSLYQPPYSMDIFDTSITKFIDLLTGKVVVFAKNYDSLRGKTDLPFLDDYVLSMYHGGPAMFLALTGPNASDVIISCSAIGRLFNLDGFYVDQFGDSDRGFKRGAILALSKDRLENALDKLLSGDVILY